MTRLDNPSYVAGVLRYMTNDAGRVTNCMNCVTYDADRVVDVLYFLIRDCKSVRNIERCLCMGGNIHPPANYDFYVAIPIKPNNN